MIMHNLAEQLEWRHCQHAPLSVQLARYLLSEVTCGRLEPAQKMPSVRQLAEQFGYGRQVVLSALTLLVKQNILCSAARQGYYINPSLRRGRYYRLGYFLNRINPASSGKQQEALYFAARQRGWELIFGSNFEEDYELLEWLQRKTDLDGVFINGIVDESILRTLSGSCLPHVIIGNHEIGPEYVQVSSRVGTKVSAGILKVIRQHDLHQLVSVVGPQFVYNEHVIAQAIRQRLRHAGLSSRDYPVMHASHDGYAEVDRLMRHGAPQGLFFLGEHCLGWQKYRRQQPAASERPLVFLTERWSTMLPRAEYDGVVRIGTGDHLEERAMQKMFNFLDNSPFQPQIVAQEKKS